MDDRIKNLFHLILIDPDPDVRRRAAEDLAECNDRNVLTVLSLALQDENKGVEDAVSRSLLHIGGVDVARAVVHHIGSDSITLRNRAAKLLIRLGEASVHALVPYLRDSDKDVRKSVVDILGEIKSREPIYYLLPLLNDTDPNVHVATLEAFGNIGSSEVIKPIIDTFERCPFARIVTIEALGKIGGTSIREYLECKFKEALSDDSTDGVYLFALLDALGIVGDRKTLDVLLASYDAIKKPLRDVLLHEVVQIIERYNLEYQFEDKVRNDLLHALHNDNHAIQLSAAKGLAQFRDIDVTKALLHFLGISEEMDCVVIAQMSNRLRVFQIAVECLEERVSRGKIQIIMLLGKLAAEFVRMFRNFDGHQIDVGGLERAFDLSAEAWNEVNQEEWEIIAETLFLLDCDRAAAVLYNIMLELDPLSRLHMIDQLIVIPVPPALDCVARFADDENEMVREAVFSALRAVGYPVDTAAPFIGNEPIDQGVE